VAQPPDRRRDSKAERKLEAHVGFPVDARHRARLEAAELGRALEERELEGTPDSLAAIFLPHPESQHLCLRQTECRTIVWRTDLLDDEREEAGDEFLVVRDEHDSVGSQRSVVRHHPGELILALEQRDHLGPALVIVGPLLDRWFGHGPQSAARVARMSTRDFFESLESRVDQSKTAGMNNSYLFDIDGAGKWLVQVEDGKVKVSEGGDDADAVITASEETFTKLVSGEQNPTSAYMTGKLKVKGDMGAAMKLQKLF
jgi:putative sterol carrier protein